MFQAYLLFGLVAGMIACVFLFVAIFLFGGKNYALKGTMEYERLTWGNPLNALFIDRLLTPERRHFAQIRNSRSAKVKVFFLTSKQRSS